MWRKATFQRSARAGDTVKSRAERPEPPSQLARLHAGGPGGGFKSRPGPKGSLPRRRKRVGRVVEIMHKGLDDCCGIVDLGLQEFARTLLQPDECVIRHHHMREYRKRATDHNREQEISDRR